MENKTFNILRKCLFCGCELKGAPQKQYASGDMIKCKQCEEMNDYNSLQEVALEKGKGEVLQYAKVEISKMLKKAFK
ncbi:MAG: hypothetical protein KGZ69_12225 [Methylomonas sp.]|nr:hypothetical protein [Methylomonas sp.]